MIPFIIIASVQAAVGQAMAAQAKRRAELGLPPLEIKQTEPDKTGEVMLWLWLILGMVISVAPIAALMYAAIKLAFAMNGVDF